MKHLISLVVMIAVLGLSTGLLLGDERPDSLVFKIHNDLDEGELTEVIDVGSGEFHIKVDLLKITHSEVVPLKSAILTAKFEEVVSFKFGFRSAEAESMIPYTIELLPRITSDGDAIEFGISLFSGDRKIKEEVVTVKPRDSVIVELLKNKVEESKISFRIMPVAPAEETLVQGPEAESMDQMIIRESFKYDVQVDVMLVPVYAVAADGNPVLDLKKRDLSLFINGKPTKILQLRRYEFGPPEEGKDELALGTKVDRPAAPDRVIFMVFDQAFSSWKGIRRAKDIGRNIVEQSLPGDRFVVLTYSPGKDLRFMSGPNQSKKETLGTIDHIRQLQERKLDFMYDTMNTALAPSQNWSSTSAANRPPRSAWGRSRLYFLNQSITEEMEYKAEIARLGSSFARFKYALKTIVQPKVVLLISEGVARQSFNTVVRGGYEKNKSRFNNYLAQFFQTIGKAVNEGGGVLYTVNSQRLEDMEDEGKSGESSLLAMARHGGGKYFAGSTSVDIAGEFKRNTAAYYELLFTPERAMGERLRIGMQSKRRGIEVHTIKYSEMQRPYGKMNRLQKKLFALDVAKKGDWSRMHASILPAKYKVLGRAKKRGMVATNIEVELPLQLRNKPLDICKVRLQPKTQEAHIDISSVEGRDTVRLTLEGKKREDVYFVVIEPEAAYGITNRL